MADIESNIHVNIDTSDALASLKLLQRQISAFHTQMAKSGTAASAVAANQAQNLMNSINATGQFQASMRKVTTSTEQFTDSLERNKLTSREYFRYTGAATKTFGRLFKSEFETINKVARERVKDIQTQYIKLGRGANGALQGIAVRPLTLDMKNLGTQTAIAAQRQQLLNQLLKQGSTNLLNFGKNTQWAGRQLMVGFTVPLAMLGTTAAKTFMKLEEQAIRFKRVYGEMFTTQEETDAMVKQIQTLAKEYTKYGVAIEDTMKMAADAAAMGKMGAELTAQVAQATRLAVLGGVEQAQALETTISVTNAFGVATEDLANKIDFLNAVENQTVVSIEDLTIAIPKAGPVVQQLGGDVEDLAFFLTAMKEGGINASEGANALKSGLASLINPSEKASKMLAGLGVNIRGIVEANKGDIKGTVVGFAQALDTLDPLNRARAIEQLFGKFQFSRLSTLFQNVTAQGTQAQRVLGLTKATTEELAILSQRELDKIQNTTTYKFKKSMEDLKMAIAPVGEQFLKALTPIVEFVGKILEKFNNLGDGSKKFLTIFTVAVAGIGPVLLMTFGLIANAVANIIKLFASMKSMYNRTGNSSKVLGEQTSYLTKEQLEASAVAASLDQVHTKLNQTFTSEATAVNALANAYKRAIAAQAGFTGPVRGGAGAKGIKKYSTGTTEVPGIGNRDTVPAMLTPGEAVIPAQVAQNPAMRPIIGAMVNGSIQGFNSGTEEVTPVGKRKKPTSVFAHAMDKRIVNVEDLPDEFESKRRSLSARQVPKANVYGGLGFDIPEDIHKALTNNQLDVREYERAIKKAYAVETMTTRLMSPPLNMGADDAAKVTNRIRKNLLLSLKDLPDGYKIGDKTIYSRMGNLKTGIIGGLARDPKFTPAVERIMSAAGVGGYSTPKVKYDKTPATPAQLLKAVEATGQKTIITAVQRLADNHPNYPVSVRRDANGNIVAFERPEVSTKPPYPIRKGFNSGVLDGEKWQTGRSDGSSGSVKIGGQAKKKVLEAARRVLDGLGPEEIKGRPITTYAKHLATGGGFSNIAARDASGVYETADGKKVYVKPMIDERSALAEQRATQIARDVHGLDAPDQKLRIIEDPITGKKMFALESAFDPKFDPSKMSNKFTKEEYIKQNVAAALRADKDLGRGNLSGNILADVGPAGVFGTASGKRDFAANLPSMEEQARINLGIDQPVKGRKKFFAEETFQIAKGMSAEEYDKAMKAEINRVLPKLKKTVASFDLSPEEKPVYKAMVDRLEAGLKVDWKKIHKLHSSIVVKPDEMLEDKKTGKLTKPKTKRKPANVKSSSGSPKDTRVMEEPKENQRVVQKPKRVRVGKVIRPGFADAPESMSSVSTAIIDGARGSVAEAKAVGANIGTTLSQSAAAASRTMLYGMGPVDAEAKSLRRQQEKRQRAEARTQAKIAASKTRLYGTGPIDADAKSLRRQEQLRAKRSAIAEKAAYRQQIISERAAAKAQADAYARSPRGRIQAYGEKRAAKTQARIDAGKKPGMGVGGALGIASGATMIGSMAGGKVGEISQQLMMPLMGLSMIAPMLKSPAAALAIGLTATVGSFVALRMAFDKAANKVLEEGEKFKGSTSAIDSIAKFSGKVTASEQMDMRRRNSFQMLGPATGKTSYGEAFIQTEEGKALTKRISEQNAAGKGNIAAKDLSGQLTASIMSGAIDMGQAKSLAMNAARQAGDMSIGLKVIAQMESLLGPNGENLDKNPLQVRIDMIAQNSKNMKATADNAKNGGGGLGGPITKLAGQKTMQVAGIGASALGGAAAGAGIGGMIGGALGAVGGPLAVITAGIGATIGAGIGAAVGGIGAFFASKKFAKQAGTLGAAAAVDSKIALEQNKQMLDSFDMYYQKKIEELRLQGKINEANEMQTKYIKERDKLTTVQGKLQGDIVSQYNNAGGLQEAMMGGMKKATTARYKNDPNQLAYVDVVNEQAKNLRSDGLIDSGQEYLIQAKMASGDIPPAVFRTLLGLAAENKDIAPKMMNIITKFSGATSESIGVAAQNILGSDDVVDKKVQTQFITRVEAFEKESDALDFTKNIIKLNNLNTVIPSAVMVSYYTDPKNKEAYEKLNKMLDSIEGSKDLTAKLVYEIMPEVKGTAAFDEAYFNTLTEDQQKVYTTTISTLINVPEAKILESEDFKAWRKENQNIKGSKSYIVQKYIESQGNKAVTDNVQVNTNAPATGGGTTEKAKVEASPLDDLVKKLRDVRKNQIKVTEGWSASRKALDGLFGGSKTIDVFSGIENDIRKLGGSQDFIEMIVGMDPKEYEKRKNSLFKFDNKGNIIGLKRDAKNIQEAMNSIAMGDWNSSMEEESKALDNQTRAFDRIAGLGVPVANAYDLITDKTIAQAIANGVNDKTLKSLVTKYKALTAAQEKAAAVSGVKTDIAQFKKDVTQQNRLRAKYSTETAVAIGSDENLKAMESAIATQEALVQKRINSGADKELIVSAQNELNKLVNDFNERLNQLKNTVEFMSDLFNEGFGNAMESFDVQEQALQIKFKLDTKGNAQIIEDAQNEIAAAQYKIDDKEAALRAVADQEEKINQKYDERIKALDEVEKANAAISNQQKGQLTLAEALTSGDIAAAARAAQDMRAQQAAEAVTKQKDAIEQSRQFELSGVKAYDPVTKTYRTRQELEADIKKLQDEIFKIEEDKIEPAQEFIRLRQIQLDKDIEGITVLGKTKDAWEAIKNQVDLAMISSAKFVESMQLAISTQGKLIQGYKDQKTIGNDPTAGAYVVPASTGETAEQKSAREAAEKAAAEAAAKAANNPTAVSAARSTILNTAIPAIQSMQKAGNTDAAEAATVSLMKNLAAVAPSTPLTSAQIVSARKQALGYLSSGGMVPKYFAEGGFARGTDTVPAMLTPGEFVMSKYAVDSYGVDNLKKINSGDATSGAVYNNTYTLTVNAKTNANPNEIAQAVMSTIKQVDDRRVRGVNINGR
jgi:TP901 family phage tail tape measure protein